MDLRNINKEVKGMDFNAFLKSVERLEQINRELWEIENTDYIERRVREIFPENKEADQRLHDEINAIVVAYIC